MRAELAEQHGGGRSNYTHWDRPVGWVLLTALQDPLLSRSYCQGSMLIASALSLHSGYLYLYCIHGG